MSRRFSVVAAGFAVAAVLALAACSAQKPADGEAPASHATARQKTVFDDSLKALDKAKAVEKQMQDDKARADRAIEEAGG